MISHSICLHRECQFQVESILNFAEQLQSLGKQKLPPKVKSKAQKEEDDIEKDYQIAIGLVNQKKKNKRFIDDEIQKYSKITNEKPEKENKKKDKDKLESIFPPTDPLLVMELRHKKIEDKRIKRKENSNTEVPQNNSDYANVRKSNVLNKITEEADQRIEQLKKKSEKVANGKDGY